MPEHSEQHKKLEEEILKLLSSKEIQDTLQQAECKIAIVKSFITLLNKNQNNMTQSTPDTTREFIIDMLVSALTGWRSLTTICDCASCTENTANIAKALVNLGYTLAMEKDTINTLANQWTESKLHKGMMANDMLGRDITSN